MELIHKFLKTSQNKINKKEISIKREKNAKNCKTLLYGNLSI